MTIRSRSIIAGSALAVLVGVAVLWFAVIREKPKSPVEQPAEQPQTLAGPLIGKWKLVRHKSRLPASIQATTEYTKDGRVIMWSQNPLENMPQVQTGTYRLDGNILRIIMDGAADVDDKYRTLTLVSITEDKHVLSAVEEGDPHVYEYEYERVR
jgi:hypothetical protein